MEASPEFDAPIPGMGMTAELGGRPWQSPPQYPTVEKAIEYYIERITTAEFKSQLLDVLEMGVTVTAIVNTIQLSSVMEGVHSADVGILISPVLMEFIMLIADKAGVKYQTGLEEDTKEPRKSLVMKSLNKLREEEASKKDNPDMESIDETEPEEVIAEEPVAMGLMARRA